LQIDFAEGVPTKSQKFFYLRQKGAYSNRETLDKVCINARQSLDWTCCFTKPFEWLVQVFALSQIEKIVEDEMGGEGLDTAYFVGSVLYDDPSKKDKDSCQYVYDCRINGYIVCLIQGAADHPCDPRFLSFERYKKTFLFSLPRS
jgi:hypothetical protein